MQQKIAAAKSAYGNQSVEAFSFGENRPVRISKPHHIEKVNRRFLNTWHWKNGGIGTNQELLRPAQSGEGDDLPRRPGCYFGTVTVPVLVLPRGPVTVPFAVEVLPLPVVVPLTVDIPPFGPVMLPLSVVPVLVLVAVPDPLTVLPRTPVAVPLAFTVPPVRLTELEAVPPRLPVTDF